MQVILFDVDGVLIDGYHYRPEYRKCWHKNLKEDFGIDPEYFSNTFFHDPYSTKVLMGKMDLREALKEWLPSAGYFGDVNKFIKYWLENDSALNMRLIEKIKYLKKSNTVRLFIATNQEKNRVDYLMNTLGLSAFFDDIFYSAKLQAMKPSKEYFDYISDYLNLSDYNKPIIFDDTPKVIEYANLIGWHGYEFIDADSVKKSPFVNKILQHEKVIYDV